MQWVRYYRKNRGRYNAKRPITLQNQRVMKRVCDLIIKKWSRIDHKVHQSRNPIYNLRSVTTIGRKELEVVRKALHVETFKCLEMRTTRTDGAFF
jgi:hypothetical protein